MGNTPIYSGGSNIPINQAFAQSFSTGQPYKENILGTLTGNFSSGQTFVQALQTAQTQQKDIIVKCSLEQMVKRFFQDYVIVWHDPNVDSQENKQSLAQLKKFCEVFTFTEWEKASDFIQSSPTACHVVTSGTNGELLVKEISSNQNVVKIYIFCGNKDYHSSWAKKYPKVSCVETNIESVLSRIQQNLLDWYKQASSLKLNLPAFAPIFNDSDKSTMNNLHHFLKVIPNFQNRLQAKNDFLNLSKAIYSDPQNTKFIADFEQNYNTYDKEQTLRWYSQESFLYKVTNNCLRIATADSVQYCRLLLKDIEQAIKEQYQTKSKNFNGLLYRGAYLSQEEWSSLKANLNGEIEMHGFLSVTKLKNVGLNFMKTDPSKKALITIIVPKGRNEGEQGFAEMEEFSEYPQEKEILFNVRSRFTVLETEDEDSQGEPYRHLVLLYGAQGFRKYLTEQNPILEVPIPGPENVFCSHCGVVPDKICFLSLTNPQKQIYCCQSCIDHNLAPFLCIPPSKKRDKPCIKGISGCLLLNSHPTELPFYGYQCSKCYVRKQKQYFTCIDCDQKLCRSCFFESSNSCIKALHTLILETHHPFSFWYQKMSSTESHHLKFQNNLVSNSYYIFRQGQMYMESQLYDKAIEYYKSYIQQNEAKGKDCNLSYCYNSLGLAFQKQGEGRKALESYLKSLEIDRSIYGDNHPQIASTYSNIGYVYFDHGEYPKALECYFKALDSCRTVYGPSHPDLDAFYSNIGLVYSSQGEYKKALDYYFKSLETAKSAHGENHPTVGNSYQNIGLNLYYQGEYKKALPYHFKALEIQKSLYGENHPSIAIIYNSIGLAYNLLGEYKNALEYQFKAVEIQKLVCGDKHPDLAVFYQNLGCIFENLAEYAKALEYDLKGLEIQKSLYGDSHPAIATSYNNVGLTFYRQGEYNKALEYYFKALNAAKGNHPTLPTFYNNIGIAYTCQGEYKKALEYYFKALDAAKLIYGKDHPTVALSYNYIGIVFRTQGEYVKALEYSFKSLGINKLVYGENHSEVADNYSNIGGVYRDQGEYKKALEYYFKALSITKSVYGDNHPKTIEAQKRILEIQSIPSLH